MRPSFEILLNGWVRVLEESLISNKEVKIKEKEKVGGVIKQRN
jgi:hypothetical protein